MEKLARSVWCLLSILLPVFVVATNAAHAESSALNTFVVTLDNESGIVLSKSQSAAAASSAADSFEIKFGVSLKEEFLTPDYRYEILKAKTQEDVKAYLAELELTPISIIESEFTNSPELGGGPKASDVPRDGHSIYVIERAVPEISSMPLEKQKEISQGSQSVVEQIGNSLEWDKSFLTQEGTFCVYRTDDEKHIMEHAKIAGFPADKVSAVEHIVHNYEF